MARKPLSEKTIVENVLKYGTGAIDIDGCRIHIQDLLNEPEHRPNAINHITNKGENSIFNHGGVRWKVSVVLNCTSKKPLS